MKKLSEISKHIYQINSLPKSEFNTFDEYLFNINKTYDTVSESDIKFFDENNFNSLFERRRIYLISMNEMLNSTSSSTLLSLIDKNFSIIDCAIYTDSNEYSNSSQMLSIDVNSEYIDLNKKHISKDTDGNTIETYGNHLSNKELESVIHKHQYFITNIVKISNDVFRIICEPKYTKITSTTSNIGYHVIYTGPKDDKSKSTENLRKIRKVGIRPQVGLLPSGEADIASYKNEPKKNYKGVRYFPERTYLFLDNKNIKDNLYDFIVLQQGWHFGEYVIFKFKTNNIVVFHNPASTDKYNCFTYDGIAKSDILEEITDYIEIKSCD